MEIIIGAVVSLIVQFAKKYSPNEWVTLLSVVLLSVVAAAVYQYFVATDLWGTAVVILGTAGAFYTFIIQRFE